MNGHMIHVSDDTFKRLLDMKQRKIRGGDYHDYCFDDLVAELLDQRDARDEFRTAAEHLFEQGYTAHDAFHILDDVIAAKADRDQHHFQNREDDEEERFHSDYNEFVSEQMKHYSDKERRSGKALREIAEKWQRQKNDGGGAETRQ